MRHSLLILESDSTPPDASVRAALAGDATFRLAHLPWEAVSPGLVRRERPDAVVAVATPFTPTVTALLEALRANPIETPTIAVIPSHADDALVRLAACVSDDFLLTPVRSVELRQRLERVLGAVTGDVTAVRERLLTELGITQLVGRDPVFLEAVRELPHFARSDAPVLITGETGTGKELCARAIHFLSERRDYPFVAVDCGALPDHLLENELFGHARGAYTDAHREQRGLVAMAEGGTLFLDEIDTLSPTAQGKLLRLLQERTYRPLGADRFVQADVVFVSATNRTLERMVGAKQFRSDLFYRLNVLRLHLPPLRERRGDIALLTAHFLEQVSGTGSGPRKRFSEAALRKLEAHEWPGNLRELLNVVKRAVAVDEGPVILPNRIRLADSAPQAEEPATFRSARADAVAAFERRYIEQLLSKHAGNVSRAAREAEKERRAFGRLVKKYGIDRHSL